MDLSDLRFIIDSNVPIDILVKRLFPEYHQNVDQDYSIVCPFHVDSKPSLRVYKKENYARCFGCARAWGPVQFWAEAHEITLPQAADSLLAEFDLDVAQLDRMYTLAKDSERSGEPLERYMFGGLTKELIVYLKRRGINERTMKAFGLYEVDGRVIFPHKFQKTIFCVSTRKIDSSLWGPVHTSIIGPLGYIPFGLNQIDYLRPVWVCESPIDALSLLQENNQIRSILTETG